jgi:Ca-activated chloride channel family protein
MKGEKITSARSSLRQFINLLDDRDRLQVIAFNDEVTSLDELSLLGEKRQNLDMRVSGITEGGGTALYDATIQAYQAMEENGDPDHIRAIVVLSDGRDTESTARLEDVLARINSHAEEGGNAAKLFTIAFGKDADQSILGQIAEATGGRVYFGDPASIAQIYAEIATFF